MFGNKEDPNLELAKKEYETNTNLTYAQLAAARDPAYEQKQKEREDLTKWQQDLDNSIVDLKFDLMRQSKNEDGVYVPEKIIIEVDGQFKEIDSPPYMNSMGLSSFMNIVKTYLNRNVMMSNLDANIIRRMLITLKIKLVLNLGENYEIYEADESHLSLICKKIMDTVEPTLYRSLNNGERRYLNTINRRLETFADGLQQPKKKGLFGIGG